MVLFGREARNCRALDWNDDLHVFFSQLIRLLSKCLPCRLYQYCSVMFLFIFFWRQKFSFQTQYGTIKPAPGIRHWLMAVISVSCVMGLFMVCVSRAWQSSLLADDNPEPLSADINSGSDKTRATSDSIAQRCTADRRRVGQCRCSVVVLGADVSKATQVH